MNYAKYELFFSKTRLSRYLNACKGDTEKAIALYKYNIQVSQALYPLLSILEIALRNAIDRELAKHFNTTDWLITKRDEFSTHPGMTRRRYNGRIIPDRFFAEKLRKAENKLNTRKIRLSHSKLLAELTFGFWIKFFDSSAIKILKGRPLQAFTNRPPIKLGLIHSHLNAIVTLRNRISHSEPVCFNNKGERCLSTIRKYETNIIEVLKWLDEDLKKWSNEMNYFKTVFEKISGL